MTIEGFSGREAADIDLQNYRLAVTRLRKLVQSDNERIALSASTLLIRVSEARAREKDRKAAIMARAAKLGKTASNLAEIDEKKELKSAKNTAAAPTAPYRIRRAQVACWVSLGRTV